MEDLTDRRVLDELGHSADLPEQPVVLVGVVGIPAVRLLPAAQLQPAPLLCLPPGVRRGRLCRA
ncbi:hypothetical protein [Streptomyces sp. NPDC005046]